MNIPRQLRVSMAGFYASLLPGTLVQLSFCDAREDVRFLT